MPAISDEEFGTVTLRRSNKASAVRIRIGTDGSLRASLPPGAPVSLVKRLIDSSRPQLRAMLRGHHGSHVYSDGMQVGKSHTLVVRPIIGTKIAVARRGRQIIASLPGGIAPGNPEVQTAIRPAIIEALRQEAKHYLPRRLAFLADRYGFSYQKVRFSHASSRWGSCTSQGTISLNIALMKLPHELIDYVLLHELCHTVELNHSPAFWSLVERCDPEHLAHRRNLKRETPSI